jgi:Peptidase family M48
VQVPARQAAERDEEQSTAWREETWPEMKGPRRTWAPGESSRTNPATGLQAADGTDLGSAVLCPVADAAISRRAELTADRFAADHGLALELAGALQALGDGHPAARGWSQRLLASHPTSDQRIRALLTATAAPPSDGDGRMSGLPDRADGEWGSDRPPATSRTGTLYAPNTPVPSRPQPS